MLSSGIPWNNSRVICVNYKWQVAYSIVSHEKALHNYFIPSLNLRKTYRNFGKGLEISAEFPKTSGTLQTRFWRKLKRFIKFLENFRNRSKVFPNVLWFFKIVGKSSEILGSVRKSSEIFGKFRKRFKSNFQIFLWVFKIFGKSLA